MSRQTSNTEWFHYAKAVTGAAGPGAAQAVSSLSYSTCSFGGLLCYSLLTVLDTRPICPLRDLSNNIYYQLCSGELHDQTKRIGQEKASSGLLEGLGPRAPHSARKRGRAQIKKRAHGQRSTGANGKGS